MANPRPPTPLPSEQWPIRTIWARPTTLDPIEANGEEKRRVARFWYIAFCLLISSIHDRATGRRLTSEGRKSWAATSSYYSALHCGRLLCFLTVGTYPCGHTELAKFLSDGNRGSFNWPHACKPFKPLLREAFGFGHDPISVVDSTFWGKFAHGICCSREQVERFGKSLNILRTLREDTNYEALLICHQHDHPLLKAAFDRLVAASREVADIGFCLASNAYRHWLTSVAPERLRTGLAWCHESSLRYVLRERFESLLSDPERETLIRSLDIAGVKDEQQGRSIWDACSHPLFDGKRKFMSAFEEKIELLEKSLQTEGTAPVSPG